MTRTKGEALFEQYLGDRGIGFDYEVGEGGRRPDYRLKTAPAVYCEVKDFTFGPEERAEMEGFHKGSRVGSKGPEALYDRIRDAIGKAAKQLRTARGKPCVVVLHNAGSLMSLAPFLIGGAMFGDPAITVPLDGGELTPVFTGGRMLGDTKNTSVSAVAVLSRVNANQHLIDERLARLGPWQGPGLPTSDRVTAVVEAMTQLLNEKPEAGLQVACLRIHHNPFALAPLPEEILKGPNDQHFKFVR